MLRCGCCGLFVELNGEGLSCYSNKIESVCFKKMSISSLTCKQSAFKRYHSDKHFSEFLPTRWRQKSTGIDMEQNYVTVTLCIAYCIWEIICDNCASVSQGCYLL